MIESFKTEIRTNFETNASQMNESISELNEITETSFNEIKFELWHNLTVKFEEQDRKIAEFNQTKEETMYDYY